MTEILKSTDNFLFANCNCYKMLQNASNTSKYFKMLQMLQNASKCFKMLQNASKCFKYFKILQNASNASKCLEMLQNTSKCFKMPHSTL